MGKVNVVVVDATGNKEQKVGLPDDIKCGVIMVKLVEKIKLPSVGPDGNPISYKFIHKVTGKQLLETQTLGEAGIKDGDVLRLQPEITAGACCTNCGSELKAGAVFCPMCGTAVPSQPVAPQAAPVQPVEPQPVPVQPVAPQAAPVQPVVSQPYAVQPVMEPKNSKNAWDIIGGIVLNAVGTFSGALSMLLGLVLAGFSTGYWESSSTYGGDAYTGIQNAAAQTANNVQDLAAIAKFGFSTILILFGMAIFCYFGSRLVSNFKNKGN